jgi:uncharacterized protein (DUF1786 family)
LKILALDIGAGTKDILLYDNEKNVQNCIKMVFPSPSLLFSKKLARNKKDVFIDGYTIGGGHLISQLKRILSQGNHVLMTEESAFTLYNNLDRVRGLGIEIVNQIPIEFQGLHITFDEVNINQLATLLSYMGEELEDMNAIAIAVQDHGVSSGNIDQNKFRLAKFKEFFTQTPKLSNLLFTDLNLPEYYFRMKSAIKALKKHLPKSKVFIMDSTIAAILGCLYEDLGASNAVARIAVNIGNSHITAVKTLNWNVISLMEHHTELLSLNKFENFLTKLRMENLNSQELIEDGGHGAIFLGDFHGECKEEILITGPRQELIKHSKLKLHTAAPTGDIMITGAYGLAKSVEEKMTES